MSYINEPINYINISNNYINEENIDEIGWVIDRNPDNNIINNIINNIQTFHPIYEAYTRHRYFEQQYAELVVQSLLMNRNYRNNINYNGSDDFIPFNQEDSIQSDQIEFEVQEFEINEEDKNCCICMETREESQICMLNCSHKFCADCLPNHITRVNSCPLCRQVITKISIQNNDVRSKFT